MAAHTIHIQALPMDPSRREFLDVLQIHPDHIPLPRRAPARVVVPNRATGRTPPRKGPRPRQSQRHPPRRRYTHHGALALHRPVYCRTRGADVGDRVRVYRAVPRHYDGSEGPDRSAVHRDRNLAERRGGDCQPNGDAVFQLGFRLGRGLGWVAVGGGVGLVWGDGSTAVDV